MRGSVARTPPSPRASSTGSAAAPVTTRTGVHSVHRHRPQAVDSRTLPPVHGDAGDAERGSTLPFVLVCWLVAVLMVFGAIAASDAFLEQQEVQSVCDGAALAAANSTDE